MKLTLVCALVLFIGDADAHRLGHKSEQRGIFSKMIELATSEDKAEAEHKEAVERKKQQLVEAEKDYQKWVKEEEEENEKAKEQEEERMRLAEQKARDERLAKEHEDLLKQLADVTHTQLSDA